MFRGFYTATSGMLTQSRVLNTISNNMGNVSTPGFKKDTMTSTNFRDEVIYRVGLTNKSAMVPVGPSSGIRVVDGTSTNFAQAGLDQTGRSLDFALTGDGFFQIQGPNGPVYTRNGAFTLDQEGYLSLPRIGRVMGTTGEIYLGTDQINVDKSGMIFANGAPVAELAITQFNDNAQLRKVGEGMFQSTNAANIVPQPEGTVVWKALELSNVDSVAEMVSMMESQRALQSASQMVKMYDQLLSRVVTEVGRL